MYCNKQLVDVIKRGLEGQRQNRSKAGSLQLQQQPEDTITISKKEYQYLQDTKCTNIIRQTLGSKTGSFISPDETNQLQVIHDFIFS